MKNGDWIRITKIKEQPHARVRSDSLEKFCTHGSSGLSLPVDYWMEGYLHRLPVVGSILVLDRRIRYGVRKDGTFASSTILGIQGNFVMTRNSIYFLEKGLSPEDFENAGKQAMPEQPDPASELRSVSSTTHLGDTYVQLARPAPMADRSHA